MRSHLPLGIEDWQQQLAHFLRNSLDSWGWVGLCVRHMRNSPQQRKTEVYSQENRAR